MIPTRTEDITVQTTIGGEKIKMRIDEDATEHIIALLTDLYSDPEQAIVREVATNALDSHAAVGQTRPIEVTTPTPLLPTFKVQDFGLGLDADGFRNIYSLYGRSTKTDTNEQTGSLGLGCKSPLTYTHQFTVIGIKNGVKTSVMVTRNEDGIPVMDIVDTSPTDEGNGVSVIIPAKRYNEIEKKARQIFKYWPKGSVLLNGQEPTHLEGKWITDRICLVDEYAYHDRNMLVMGNVAYPIADSEMDLGLSYNQRVIFYAPMGSVHFVPSREALNYTRRTKNTLAEFKREFHAALLKAAQQDIDAQASPPQAMLAAIGWVGRLPAALQHTEFKYKGKVIPDSIEHSEKGESIILTEGERPLHMGRSSTTLKLGRSHIRGALWVYGFNRSFTAACKKRLWLYCDQHGLPHPHQFALTAKKVRSPWLDSDRFIDWSEVEKIKLPRKAGGASGGTGRLAGSYDVYVGGQGWQDETPADEIEDDVEIFYDDNRGSVEWWGRKLDAVDYGEYVIVLLYPNRVGKFKRMFPQVTSLHHALRGAGEAWWESLDLTTKEAVSIASAGNVHQTLRKLNAGDILDPELRRAIFLAKRDVSKERDILRSLDVNPQQAWRNPTKRYPLMFANLYNTSSAEQKQHKAIYINAVWKELYSNA